MRWPECSTTRGEAQMTPTGAMQRCGTSMPIWQAVAFIESAFAQRVTLATLAKDSGPERVALSDARS